MKPPGSGNDLMAGKDSDVILDSVRLGNETTGLRK